MVESGVVVKTEVSFAILKRRLFWFSVFNLLLLSIVGVILRLYPLIDSAFFDYKNVLHAHSHFAFGGWVMPILLALVLKYFPEITGRISYRHLRNISVSILGSAYGMLLSFPFRGYAPVSIVFSTLSVFASVYMAIELWKATRQLNATSVLFLKAGLVFLVLSALGPFATAPLIAMGKAGTPLYYNVIYFYLHFQYNGWFTFATLAVLYKMIEKIGPAVNGRLVYRLLAVGCIPSYFLSTLWSRPHGVFYFISMGAALMQLMAVVFLLKDLKQLQWRRNFVELLFRAAILCFIVKNVLQAISAIPVIADLAWSHRNYTIAYLHMVLVGFISLGALSLMLKSTDNNVEPPVKTGLILFVFTFILTETFLVLNAAGINIQIGDLSFQHLMFVISLLFPLAILLILTRMASYTGNSTEPVRQRDRQRRMLP